MNLIINLIQHIIHCRLYAELQKSAAKPLSRILPRSAHWIQCPSLCTIQWDVKDKRLVVYVLCSSRELFTFQSSTQYEGSDVVKAHHIIFFPLRDVEKWIRMN